MKRTATVLGTAVFLIAIAGAFARADIALPKILGDDMVLQQGRPVPIGGTAAGGERVTVHFADQEKATTADAAGKWRVDLDALTASAEPREMTVAAGNTIRLSNILVG